MITLGGTFKACESCDQTRSQLAASGHIVCRPKLGLTQINAYVLSAGLMYLILEELGVQWRNSTEGYGAVPQMMHWITVVLVILAWSLGQFDDIFPKGAARAASLFVHISAGLAVIAILVLRLLWRLADPPPPIERTILGVWLDRAGRLTHYVLYALLIAVPVSGIILQFSRGDALPLFGLVQIASPWVGDRTFEHTVKEVHEAMANALVILAAFHAAAALVHHWVLRDQTLVRMLPRA
jgi:cytochrome b561